MNTEQWGIFELTLEGPKKGNPFKDIQLSATFKKGSISKKIDGFYDGNGIYKVRFMPDKMGQWSYTTKSNSKELNNHKGSFKCIAPSKSNHGPVRVRNTFHFAYEDGTPFLHMGTTCYGWTHQKDDIIQKTLRSLKKSPYNKVRTVLGTPGYSFFEQDPKTKKDTNKFCPDYFRILEKRILQLQELGIQADILLFHFKPIVKEEYAMKYFMARISSFRNIWWCMANEFEFIKQFKMDYWHSMFKLVRKYDPYDHLRSIHNGKNENFYDHTKPWVTHIAVQHQKELPKVVKWRRRFNKPIVLDEIGYEGDCGLFWGNLTAEEMVERCWTGYARGGYPGHGEIFMHTKLHWSGQGGIMHGTSTPRLAFLKKIMDEAPETGIDPIEYGWNNWACSGKEGEYYLYYLGRSRPCERNVKLPVKGKYKIDVIDTWNMTITPAKLSKKTMKDHGNVKLPSRPYMAVRVRKI